MPGLAISYSRSEQKKLADWFATSDAPGAEGHLSQSVTDVAISVDVRHLPPPHTQRKEVYEMKNYANYEVS